MAVSRGFVLSHLSPKQKEHSHVMEEKTQSHISFIQNGCLPTGIQVQPLNEEKGIIDRSNELIADLFSQMVLFMDSTQPRPCGTSK